MGKVIKLTESQLKKIITKVVKEQSNLVNESFGSPWLKKITIHSDETYPDEYKIELAQNMCKYFEGTCAVGFSDGTWVNNDGEMIDDIDAYENEVHDRMDDAGDYIKNYREKFGTPDRRNIHLDKGRSDSINRFMKGEQ